MTRMITASALSVLLLLSVAAPAFAQRGGPGGGDQFSRQELLQRIQSEFEERLARELQLTDEQRAQLPRILADFGRARADLLPQRREFMGRVRVLLESHGPEEQALVLIREGRALRANEEQLLIREEDRLLEILRPSQVLLLQIIRDQFGELIRTVGGDPVGFGFPGGGRGGGFSPPNQRE